jgi:hypothetical protein
MFQVLQGSTVLAEYEDLQQAAQELLRLNMAGAPRVVAGAETVIDVGWRYIPGDCYEPTGYDAHTADAKLALRCAYALRHVDELIDQRTCEAIEHVRGLTIQAASAERMVVVKLSWTPWPGFTMGIRAADDAGIVYSRWLDETLFRQGAIEPTLDYFVAKAAEFGIALPEDKVELLRRRSQLGS